MHMNKHTTELSLDQIANGLSTSSLANGGPKHTTTSLTTSDLSSNFPKAGLNCSGLRATQVIGVTSARID